jgi:adenosylmethionine-8-amino-7-oxononanoate aminotransferase
VTDQTAALLAADRAHTWHPFTQMRDWCDPAFEPLVLVSGEGAILRDSEGREYLDGNSSIWTNLHGHNHPRLNAAIRAQLDRVAHTSFLGFTNPPAAQLAEELVALWPAGTLSRVFFSDDGSTAIEAALKMAAQFWQHAGRPARRRFVAFTGAYHGDTMGASSLGGVELFHGRFAAWQFPVTHVETITELETLAPAEIAAVVIEPVVQGANGIRLWPAGMLAELRAWCDRHDVFLIADEVFTGFGRTGTMFACQREEVVPDFIALAKGLSGGYLPLAATLTTERVYEAFLGGPERTLYYGHSFTGHQLGCAAALANLAIFRDDQTLITVNARAATLAELFEEHLGPLPQVHELRQCGLIAGIELRQPSGKPFPPSERIGVKVCLAARKHGLLTRPIGDTITLIPPYCITQEQLASAVIAISSSIIEVMGTGVSGWGATE